MSLDQKKILVLERIIGFWIIEYCAILKITSRGRVAKGTNLLRPEFGRSKLDREYTDKKNLASLN